MNFLTISIFRLVFLHLSTILFICTAGAKTIAVQNVQPKESQKRMTAKPPTNCEKVTREFIQQSLDSSRLRLIASPATGQAITFKISAEMPVHKSSTLFIESDHRLGFVHIGPFKEQFVIRFDPKLNTQHGFDNLTIYIIDPVAGLSCRWKNEEGFEFWGAKSSINIRLLKEGAFVGNHKLFRQFEVN